MLYLVDFGPSYPGLATVGYLQMKIDGTTAVARSTTGVVDFGNGSYGVNVTLNAATTTIKWDTGDAAPIYAHDNTVPQKADVTQWRETAVSDPTVEGVPNVNVKTINDVSTSGVTTIKAVQGIAVDGVITTVTNQLTAAAIATGIFQDTTAADFTTAGSIGKLLHDMTTAQVLLSTTIESANRNVTNCQMVTGSLDSNAYIGNLVVLVDDESGGGHYVARTITAYNPTNNVITWSPAIAHDPVDGGKIFIVPGNTVTGVPAGMALEATLTSMKGATFSGTTDSLEAIRDRGDTAWITATGFATPTNITAASGVTLTSAYDAAKTAAQAGDAMTVTGTVEADVKKINTKTILGDGIAEPFHV